MELTRQVVGVGAGEVSGHEEANGYLFWGAVSLFIAVPELLAAFSSRLKNAIPWPTISNLVGKDLERHHHWFAMVVVAAIALVVWHTATYPAQDKKLGRPTGPEPAATQITGWAWGPIYLLITAAVTSAVGFAAAQLDASKNVLGYSIYLTLVVMGIVVPSALRFVAQRVLAIPTLFATIALLRTHRHLHWVAAAFVALLVVLCFHLALYPWPN